MPNKIKYKNKIWQRVDIADAEPFKLDTNKIVESMQNASMKLKEVAIRRLQGRKDTITRGVNAGVKKYKNLTPEAKMEIAKNVYSDNVAKALAGLKANVSYKGEKIQLTYDTNSIDTSIRDFNAPDSWHGEVEANLYAKVPISLEITGENLSQAIKGGSSNSYFSGFLTYMNIKTSNQVGTNDLRTQNSQHRSGVLSTFNNPTIDKSDISELLELHKGKLDRLPRDADGYDMRVVESSVGDLAIKAYQYDYKKTNERSSGDTSSEKHRNGKDIKEYKVSLDVRVTYKGNEILEFQNAFVCDLTETTQYGYAKDPSQDGITKTSRGYFEQNPNLEKAIIDKLGSDGFVLV